MSGKKATCCFFGHRHLPPKHIGPIVRRLNRVLDQLICQGVTHFLSGGARGFDQIAASLVIAKREMSRNIRLTFVLPCREQDPLWRRQENALFRCLMAEADEIRHASQEAALCHPANHSRYMADHSAPWCRQEKMLFRRLLAAADDIRYVPQAALLACPDNRSRYMIGRSSCCLCALLYPFGGTSQAVSWARMQGLRIINVAAEAPGHTPGHGTTK